MAFDTPATIAVIGAGPVGIEATLYARFLGYDVLLFDKGEAASHVLKWGHITLFTPFSMNSSPLGLAALSAQDPDYSPPDPAALLTGKQWVDQYLGPLAHSDLLVDSLRTNCEVTHVGRWNFLKGEAIGDEARADDEFRIVYRDADGTQCEERADIVIDASGVFSQPNHLGIGGVPALGEHSASNRIRRDLPDVAGADRATYSGATTLVVGSGYSAATTVAALSEVVQDDRGRVIWLTRHGRAAPVAEIDDDPLPARQAVAEAANQAVQSNKVDWIAENQVARVAMDSPEAPLQVVLADGKELQVDQIISHVGFRPDVEMIRELQVHQCYASEGPMKLASALMDADADCMQQVSHGAASLVTPEPNFYILGAKSYGRNSQFLLRVAMEQIRDLFSLIGDREALDLYANAPQT